MKKSLYITALVLLFALTAFFIGRNTAKPQAVEKTEVTVLRAEKRKPAKLPEINLPVLQYTMPAQDQLDEVVQKLVGFDETLTPLQRNQMVWDLKKRNLREEDFRAIYTFLKTNPETDGPELSWHSLKNDLLIFTIADGRYKESTAQLMIDIINDPEQHEVMREYTLQYTSDFFEKHWLIKENQPKTLSKIDSQLKGAFLTTMWNMLDSQEGPIAGTSLIRLNDLSKNFPEISQAKLDKETERMIKEDLVPNSSKMAALSVASERKMHHLIDQIEAIVYDSSSIVSLRMSALHTVSTLQPDEKFIERLSKEIINNQNADRLLKRAAEMAVKKLQKLRG